ncbi:MAG: glycosyltransferase family 2 protein [Clostridia bacterium]|nr:glycosyltransferase family 2 protein [Clostridia bacterium]
MIDATAIILPKNEEKHIADCRQSMRGFAVRCVVIDCGSTDRTVEIAKAGGADVYFHEFEYYARQFNWAIDHCGIDTEWIIRLDADERFPAELNEEIEQLIAENTDRPMNGITIEADFFFLNRCMKHGPRNKRKMMLFKRSCGRIEDRRRDAHSVISEGYSVSTVHRFLHHDFKTLDNYIKRYNWYATREMQDYIDFVNGASTEIRTDRIICAQRKRKFGFYYRMPKYVRAWAWFLYNYIFRGGFLDGKEGFIYCFLECYWYRLLVDAKIYEYEKNGGEFEQLKALD